MRVGLERPWGWGDDGVCTQQGTLWGGVHACRSGGCPLPAHCWVLLGGGGRLTPKACGEGGRRSSGVLAGVQRVQPPFSRCLDAVADLWTPAPQDVWHGHICLLQMILLLPSRLGCPSSWTGC